MVPAGGQGALGIQARADDARAHDLVAPLADRATTLCCTAERRLQEVLEGGCRVPIGALALLDGETLTLDAVVASEDGTLLVRDRLTGPADDPCTVGERLAERLLAQGAAKILRTGRAAGA
jgi:hydroxymethylbilane synthase